MTGLIPKFILFINSRGKGTLYLVYLFLVYGLVKSTVYFAPLILSKELNNIQLFGEFEYALNLGQTFSTLIALGLPNAYAYFVFKKKLNNLETIFHNVYLWISILIILVLLLYPTLISNLYYNAVIIGVAFANQLFITTFYKLKGSNILSIIIDCGVYILLLGFLLLKYLNITDYSISRWSILLLFYVLVINIKYHLNSFGGLRNVTKRDWTNVFNYGIYIVLCLFLTSILTTSTRIFIEYFNGYLDVGMYSIFIRIASVIIIFHRVIIILLYRKIYTDSHQKLDWYFSILIYIVIFAGILLYLFAPIIVGRYISTLSYDFQNSKSLFLWSILQAISWSFLAVLELIIYRENQLKKYVLFLLSMLFLMVMTMVLINSFSNLETLVILKINVIYIVVASYCLVFIINKAIIFYKQTFLSIVLFSLFMTTLLVFS